MKNVRLQSITWKEKGESICLWTSDYEATKLHSWALSSNHFNSNHLPKTTSKYHKRTAFCPLNTIVKLNCSWVRKIWQIESIARFLQTRCELTSHILHVLNRQCFDWLWCEWRGYEQLHQKGTHKSQAGRAALVLGVLSHLSTHLISLLIRSTIQMFKPNGFNNETFWYHITDADGID